MPPTSCPNCGTRLESSGRFCPECGVRLAGADDVTVEAIPPDETGPVPVEMTVAELQQGMASGRFTAVALVRHYLKRIAEVDRKGPRLKAVIELNPDALGIAQARVAGA